MRVRHLGITIDFVCFLYCPSSVRTDSPKPPTHVHYNLYETVRIYRFHCEKRTQTPGAK